MLTNKYVPSLSHVFIGKHQALAHTAYIFLERLLVVSHWYQPQVQYLLDGPQGAEGLRRIALALL